MKTSQFELFIKMMELTTSTNDAEALGAMRKAYQILVSHGYTWEMLLRKQVTVLNEIEAAADADISILGAPEPLDERDFELALSGARGGFRDTLLDIQRQWEEGSLSPRQTEVVRNAAERAAERHPGGRFR